MILYFPHLKLNGFSMIELVVVALLASIVLGLGYSGYEIVQKALYQNSSEKLETNEIMRLRNNLSSYFYRAEKIKWSEEEALLLIDNDKVYFKDSLIIYNSLIPDTFLVQYTNLRVEEFKTFREEILVGTLSLKLSKLDAEFTLQKKYPIHVVEGF